MNFQVILRPEAEADIADAATWYENQHEGLEAILLKLSSGQSIPCRPTLNSFPVVIVKEISDGPVPNDSPTESFKRSSTTSS